MATSELEALAFVAPWELLKRDRDVAHEVGGTLPLVPITLGLLAPLVWARLLDNLVVFRRIEVFFGLQLNRWVEIGGSHIVSEFLGALLRHCPIRANAYLDDFDFAADYLASFPVRMSVLQGLLPLGLGLAQAA